jgi:hypothetical protein
VIGPHRHAWVGRSGGEDGDAVSEQFQPKNEEQGRHHGDVVLGCPVFPVAERGFRSLAPEQEDSQWGQQAEGGDQDEDGQRRDLLPDRQSG